MKILSLRFKNLNSLVGEWLIDFTAPEYAVEGIFAITGPTGSGKSTVLDALSLALYGQTPRLGRITKSGNEIMSRRSGECFSEVVFETLKGRYRCHWSQHRSRKQPGGELQSQKHEIADDVSGKILESKLQDTLAAVVQRTGMDFEQFTRSMLLAQGGFAAFLQARDDDRAPVLEQITGTEIYSLISMKVHERHRFEQQKLKALRDECSGIQLLDAESVAAVEAELGAKQRGEADICSRQHQAQTAFRWLRQISAMQGELEGMKGSFDELKSFEERFTADRQRMEQARRAAAFEPAYSTLCQLQELQKRELHEKSALESTLEDAQQAFAKRREFFHDAVQKLLQVKEEEKTLSVVLRDVRALDVQISVKLEQCREQEDAVRLLREQRATLERQMSRIEAELQQERKKVEKSKSYLAQHESDRTLLVSLSGLEVVVEQHLEAQQGEHEAKAILELRQQELADAEMLHRKVQQEATASRAALEISRARREELSEKLAHLLAGVDIPPLRQERERLLERTRLLDAFATRVSNAAQIGERLVVSEQTLVDIDAALSRTTLEIECVTLLQQKEAQIVEGLEHQAELLSKILSLEKERTLLLDGSPCPLCGSLHHPWAEESPETTGDDDTLRLARLALQESAGKITTLRLEMAKAASDREHGERQILSEKRALADEHGLVCNLAKELGIDEELSQEQAMQSLALACSQAAECAGRLASAEQLDTAQKLAEGEVQRLLQQLAETERREDGDAFRRKSAAAEVKRGEESFNNSRERRMALHESLRRQLAVYNILTGEESAWGDVLLVLHLRADEWQRAIDRKTLALQQIAALESSLKAQHELRVAKNVELGERERLSLAAQTTFAALQEQRQQLFGAQKPDEVERSLAKRVKAEEASLEDARSSRDKASQQIGDLSARLEMVATSSGGRALMITEKQAQLTRELAAVGFESLERFLAARLDRDALEKLEDRAKRLAARRLELETLQSERQSKLMNEQQLALTRQSPEELEGEIEQLSISCATLRSAIEVLKHQLFAHESAAALLREKTGALAAQQVECTRWTTLNELIGSADGKRYRNFAQGLTFDIMIGHANRQLVNMSDRYLLVRSSDHPLGLNVIDNYQAGEMRSTLNLSGGESFIVSLALALGLSQMSSRNVRIDSLFLDEGFGTLDEDALDTALQTLAALQQNGKIIGIISHVPALKERITTQIRVHPLSGGRSRLSGPAVREVLGNR
ncbi:MAG: AAA family ATPase [Chlorobium sp.]